MIRFFGVVAILILCCVYVSAQSYQSLDRYFYSYTVSAMDFSRQLPTGSARVMAMGGAQVALGGDVSSIYSNPAGLGMFNRGQLSVTGLIPYWSNQATYFGESKTLSSANFQLPNLSFVAPIKSIESDVLTSVNIGISYSRNNSFNSGLSYQGTNPSNSIVNFFASQADGDSPATLNSSFNDENNPLAAIAYRTYLIDVISSSSNLYTSPVFTNLNDPTDTYTKTQAEKVSYTGAQGQWNIALGLNFQDKIYLGGNIGIASIRYASQKTYSESDFRYAKPTDRPSNLAFELNENLTTQGLGINMNFGVIYRPVNFLQAGFSYRLRTSYSVAETYDAQLATSWNNFLIGYDQNNKAVYLKNVSAYVNPIKTNYTLVTPSVMRGGITCFIKKHGLVTVDVQRINYAGTVYKSKTDGVDDSNFGNDNIKSSYQTVYQVSTGGEWRMNKLYFRGGYTWMPTPYQQSPFGISNTIKLYTAGFGIRMERRILDFALMYRDNNQTYRPYRVNEGEGVYPYVSSRRTNISLLVTATFPLN